MCVCVCLPAGISNLEAIYMDHYCLIHLCSCSVCLRLLTSNLEKKVRCMPSRSVHVIIGLAAAPQQVCACMHACVSACVCERACAWISACGCWMRSCPTTIY